MSYSESDFGVGCTVRGDELSFEPRGVTGSRVKAIPEHLQKWFREGRLATYRILAEGGHAPGFFDHHLPVVSSISNDGATSLFANLGHKGVGPLPTAEELEYYLDKYRSALAEVSSIPRSEMMRRRVESVAELAADVEALDPRCLGSLEIFKKQTHANFMKHPFASLLFTGQGPDYVSFQLDCGVEVLGPGDPRHELLVLARSMFERESFHITQPGFFCAYVFWVLDVKEKTPYPVDRGHPGHP